MPASAPPTKRRSAAASDALTGLWTLALAAFVLGVLYFMREILIPLALSVLLTFLLAPLVTRMERWIGRIAAVLVLMLMIFAGVAIGGWVLTRQVIDFASKMPDYKGNIEAKLRAFKMPSGGPLSKFSKTLEDLKKDLPGMGQPTPTVVTPSDRSTAPEVLQPNAPQIASVRVVETAPASLMETLRTVVSPLLGPLGMAALVLVLSISMLFKREDLRGRLIRLIGQGNISATTRALDDAGARVSRYLLMQFIVNVCYGVPIAVGLYFIGVPNAILWGGLATVLRFIPYAGPWIATTLPTLLSLAVSTSWTTPLLTISLFVGLELLLNNVMEPLVYGSSTGVSSIALIVAAVFWTWLWGPIGLVLATPLTVCLVVMGRHVPRLRFLSIALSDEQALTPAEECYQRLLAYALDEATDLVDVYVKKNSLTALYDSVLLPVLTSAEMDHQREMLDDDQRDAVEEAVGDIVEDLASEPAPASQLHADQLVANHMPSGMAPAWRIYCLPARGDRDELAGAMLAHLLREQGFQTENLSAQLVTGEIVKSVAASDVDAVCISVVPPSTVIHARYLCIKLRSALPRLKIAVGLWGATENLTEAAQRLRNSGADEVVTTFADASLQLAKLAPAADTPMIPAPVPANEQERLAALRQLCLLNGKTDPAFDRATRKLVRLFDVPIALVTMVDEEQQVFKGQTGLPDDLASAGQSPRNTSVCGHVVAANETLVVEDLARDRRFAANPFLRDHGLRFYAGVPLQSEDGQPIGSLCILDKKPRQMTERDLKLLNVIAEEVMDELKNRRLVMKDAQAQQKTVLLKQAETQLVEEKELAEAKE